MRGLAYDTDVIVGRDAFDLLVGETLEVKGGSGELVDRVVVSFEEVEVGVIACGDGPKS
jgi:hypothetical protein